MANAKKKILIVEDVEMNRAILREAFQSEFDVLEAEDGFRGLELIASHGKQLAAIFLDIIMPELDGFGVLQEMESKGLLSTIPVFLITTETSDYVVGHAYDYGIVDVIQKPFNIQIIKRRVMNIIELFSSRSAGTAHSGEKETRQQKLQWSIIEALCAALEFRNTESRKHIQHIKYLTYILLKQLAADYPSYGLTEQMPGLIAQAAAFHDIGKVSVPEQVLAKADAGQPLTQEETAQFQNHTAAGCAILDTIPDLNHSHLYKYCQEICRSHHETWDGTGYPQGLQGNDIPVSAQAAALANAFDNLVSAHGTQQPCTGAQAIQMLCSGERGVFNPELLDCLKKCEPLIAKVSFS